MTKEMTEFKDSLKSMSVEELQKLEQELIEKSNENDKRVAKLEFDLPDSKYDTVESISDYILKLLDKHQVTWQYTLSVVELYQYWGDKTKTKINYHYLDTTLNILGNLQYKGYDECSAVVAINKYFEPLKKDYIEASTSIYDLATKHSMVISEMQLRVPIQGPGTES